MKKANDPAQTEMPGIAGYKRENGRFTRSI